MPPIVHGCLGRTPSPADPRTLRFADYYRAANLPPLPAAMDWSKAITADWGMMLNDQLGDCAIAGAGHFEMLWNFNQGKPFTPADQQILQGYEVIGGYRPGIPSTDNGCNLLSVLKYWRSRGIAGHKIAGYVACNPKDHTHVCESVYLFGGSYIGIMLPLCWQNASEWDLTDPTLSGDAAPNSWGGHCVLVAAYDVDGLWVVTWGQLVRLTWDAWDAYVDESFAVLSSDWVSQSIVAPNRFDLVSLEADLQSVAA